MVAHNNRKDLQGMGKTMMPESAKIKQFLFLRSLKIVKMGKLFSC